VSCSTAEGQNTPSLATATVTVVGPDLQIDNVTLSSVANSTYAIDFYANPAAGSLQGKRYLGSTTVTTNGSGTVTFSVTLTAATVAGERISATATSTAVAGSPVDEPGNTSPMSSNSVVSPGNTGSGGNVAPVIGNLNADALD
jgi:hypothetical protein